MAVTWNILDGGGELMPRRTAASAPAAEPDTTNDDYYFKKVGNTGLTQAQIDTRAIGREVAIETGQAIDPTSGMIVPRGTPNSVVPTNAEGNISPVITGGQQVSEELSAEQRDAYALLEETFRLYGLESMVPAIKKLMMNNVGSNQASLMLKTDPEYNAAYIKRFSGNEARRKAGLNVLSEAEYLDLENSYMKTLKAYGQSNFFGIDANSRQAAMANIIGSDISATEFKDRIDTVVTRVNNADKRIKDTLRSFYDINDEDLVGYFLNPKENLPKLQEKVTAAEIGAAATGQGLMTSRAGAEALAQFGVTQEQAREGYAAIGEVLPTATKLGEIYGDKYTQATAEEEVFKGLASAKRKRQQLAERETAAFSGSAGRLRSGRARGNEGAF